MAEDRLMISVSGVRGTIGATLTPRVACDFGCAFGGMRAADADGPVSVVVGRDSRPSGPMVQDAVVAGLLAAGANVIDLGVVSTPGAALMTRRLGAAGGVVVTASHNPPKYNGIKFLQPTGVGLTAAEARRLKEIYQGGQFALVPAERVGGKSTDNRTHEQHVKAVCSVYDTDAIAARGFHVVLDSINGAGCAVSRLLLDRLGCRLDHLNAEPTGRFAHAPEPIAENLTETCDAVRRAGADVGFAQDPDADRLVVIDENGRFIGEEYTLALAAAFVLRRRKGKVAANLSTSRMIDDVARSAGCEVIRTPTGEANVVEGMEREGCVFGGEGNGGAIDPQVVPVRDSLVGMACVLGALAETGRTVSELAGDLPSYVMVKTKFPCPAGAAEEVVTEARRAFSRRDGAQFNDTDGLRIDLPEGWVSVRASNTEPIMRIIAEADDDATANELVARVRKIADGVIERK